MLSKLASFFLPLQHNSGKDMDVQEVWEQGVTGKGVVVSILDDGECRELLGR